VRRSGRVDEPLSNLDASLRVRTRNELVRLHQRLGSTMIYVTHDQVEAMTMGSRICVMNHGKVVQVGEPIQVYRNPADTFVASFIGSPPMNLVKARLRAEDGRVVARLGGGEVTLPGFSPAVLDRLRAGEVLLGMRPEDLYLAPPPGDAAAHSAAIEASVLAVEPLGAETLVLIGLDDGGEEIIGRMGRDTRARSGERLAIHFDLAQAQLFDPLTTRVLPRPR
jgi:multiple sugar transport system ATP-binding protein